MNRLDHAISGRHRPERLCAAPRRAHMRDWLAIVVTALSFNAALTMENASPGLGVTLAARVSVEAAGLLLCAALLGRRLPIRTAALLVTLWVALRYIDVTVPALLGRPVSLYWDGQHAWQVLLMALQAGDRIRLLAPLAGAALVLVLLHLVIRRMLTRLREALRTPAPRIAALVLGTAILLAWVQADPVGPIPQARFAQPVAATLWREAHATALALSRDRSDAALPASPALDHDLSRLEAADVLLLFAEAHGMISFDAPHIADALAAARAQFAATLADAGLGILSARVRSPTFGGASWLAHAALLAGIDTREPGRYETLLTSRRGTLVSHFKAHGYRSVAWMPGIQRPWPEGRFYGFDRYGEARDIGYAGPTFGYWRIPDQAAMALLHDQELAASDGGGQRRPRFVVFPIVSSHAPFRPIPPFVEDGWAQLARAEGQMQAWNPEAVAAALAEPGDWAHPTPAYIDSLRYTLRWLGDYLATQAPEGLMVVMIGDHQPIGTVTGPDARWEVPVHVIGAPPAVADALRAAGFEPGFAPPEEPLGDMHGLTEIFVRSFGVPTP